MLPRWVDGCRGQERNSGVDMKNLRGERTGGRVVAYGGGGGGVIFYLITSLLLHPHQYLPTRLALLFILFPPLYPSVLPPNASLLSPPLTHLPTKPL